MYAVSRFLCLILVSLIVSACGTTNSFIENKSIKEQPPRIPTNLFWDIKNMEKIGKCAKPIEVVGDFEDCYKQFLALIPYIESDRCYRVKQLQQIVWVSSKGTQLVELPSWCSKD